MNPWLHKRMVFPSILLLTGQGGMYPELARLRRIEREPALLRSLAVRRLSRLLDAAAHAPFYAPSLGKLEPDHPDPFERLTRLPFLRKVDLQTRLDDLRVPGSTGGARKTTGGSTGEPVTVVKSRRGIARERAASWLAYGWVGVGIGDRAVRFWGQGRTGKRRVRSILADLAMNRKLLSAFAFQEADLRDYWDICVDFRPKYLYGYASMLEEFSRFVLQEGLPGSSLGLSAVISTAEPLTTPRRAAIAEAFEAPVQNEYGCGEVGPIAYECPEGLLHVMSQNLVVEVVGDDGKPVAPGESGQVVVTDLNNHATLLIRYAIGDYATVAEPCPCGRAFPALSAVWGRAYDFLEDPDGRRYHGESVMYVFEDLRERGLEVGRFQVLQDRPGQIRVRVVPAAEGTGDTTAGIIAATCRERLGGMATEVEFVDEIPRAPSGKVQIIRRLDHSAGGPSGQPEDPALWG